MNIHTNFGYVVFCTTYKFFWYKWWWKYSWLIAKLYDQGTSHFWCGLYFNPKTFLLTLHDHHHYCKSISSMFRASFKYKKLRVNLARLSRLIISVISHMDWIVCSIPKYKRKRSQNLLISAIRFLNNSNLLFKIII